MPPFKPTWKQPSHPDIVEVIKGDDADSFDSGSRSRISAPVNTVFAILSSPPLSLSKKAYSTVQISPTQHVALNCDFLYLNHSCEPSLELHCFTRTRLESERSNADGTESNRGFRVEIHVAKRTDLAGNVVDLSKGENLTFFYPSTEWEMAQPFQCNCGSKRCRGQISGAKDMPVESLEGYFLNEHIRDMLKERL